jgi:prepilin-type N-terminal cleavage/methylation domain-containing protein
MKARLSIHVGFTLMEIVIVLSVIGVLVAAIAPVAFTYFRDAQRAQAQNNANQIAAAIGSFLDHTGLPPYKNTTSADKIPAKESADFDCLYGSQGTTFTSAEDGTTGTSWSTCYTGSTKDTLENHLIINTPGGASDRLYKITGKTAWKGPYLPSVPSDPWGKPFLINIKNMDPAAATPKAAWVISAGQNGTLETAFDQNAGVAITAGGDDIIARVK